MKLKNKKIITDSSLLIASSYLCIKLFGTIFAIYIFGQFTPLIDSLNYINNFYYNDLASGTTHSLRTSIIQIITTFLVEITRNDFLTHLIFSFFSGIGILIYSLKTKKFMVLFFLLFPSALVWTSIVGKEAIFFGLASLILLFWIKIIAEKMKLQDWIILIFLTIFCLLFRPHYTLGFIWLLLSAFIINLDKKYILLIIFFTIFATTIIYLNEYFLFARAFTAIDPFAKASRFSTLNIDYIFNFSNLEYFKKHLYIGFVFGIIGPFPSEIINRPEFLPFFVEGIIILCFPLIFIFLMFKTKNLSNNKKKFIENLYLGIIPALIILMYLHGPFGILNPGTAIRWRVNFELIFYFAPFLIYMEYLKSD